MPSKPKVDEAAQLAERMLQVLDSQRSFGGDAYPPTLRYLGELCDGAPPDDLMVKAAGKKTFTDRAVVTERVGQKPALDALVYFKEDVPRPEELAGRMLAALEEQRRLGGAAYPPSLRRLAELCGRAPSKDLILKAATHRTFTSRAAVTEKTGKSPSLDAPVYFQEDKPSPEELLARRMLRVLESQRRAGGAAYPPSLRRLAQLCEVNASQARVPRAASHATLAERTIVAAKKGKTPILDAPVVLNEDIQEGLATVLPALLRFALRPITTAIKGTTIATAAFSLPDATKRLIPDLQPRFAAAVERGISQEDLPAGVAWVLVKGKPLLFLVENVRPAAPQPATPEEGRSVSSPSTRDTPLATVERAAPAREVHAGVTGDV